MHPKCSDEDAALCNLIVVVYCSGCAATVRVAQWLELLLVSEQETNRKSKQLLTDDPGLNPDDDTIS